MVVISTLKEAYRDKEKIVEEEEITREPAEKEAAGEEAAGEEAVEDETAKEEAAAVDVKVEIVKGPIEAWKKPKDKFCWFKAAGKTLSEMLKKSVYWLL